MDTPSGDDTSPASSCSAAKVGAAVLGGLAVFVAWRVWSRDTMVAVAVEGMAAAEEAVAGVGAEAVHRQDNEVQEVGGSEPEMDYLTVIVFSGGR
ncbi:LOW QUALITY PROTEIN: hypothetical protein U9M48_010958 [Paspalum notatum var. saurae]|uniref:Uncharacterized protein n=1 Tax=Paspalum notatum var. saurae TaxID=547442 RepID=A0AAQ3WH08_PASNO